MKRKQSRSVYKEYTMGQIVVLPTNIDELIPENHRESIPFMRLSGNNRPGFRTINYFRGHIMKGVIEKIFVALLQVLIEDGYIKLEDYFEDGIKVEANANRYTKERQEKAAFYRWFQQARNQKGSKT